ncbi:MAG: hypothetical protein WDO19_20640 [Bacteroidota bacterium]
MQDGRLVMVSRCTYSVAAFIFLKTTIHTVFLTIYPGKTQPVAGYTG